MGLFDQLQNVLTQYTAGNTPGPENPQDVESARLAFDARTGRR